MKTIEERVQACRMGTYKLYVALRKDPILLKILTTSYPSPRSFYN